MLFHQEEDQMRQSTLSIMGLVAMLCLGLAAPLAMAIDPPIDGPLANATVSFGEWQTDPSLDRFPINSPAGRNEHRVLPNTATIKAGGAVNFIISGFHQTIVYDNGTQPDDIDATLIVTSTGVPDNVVLIDDPRDRIYRGLDPSRLHLVDPVTTTVTGTALAETLGVRDRVEVVYFPNPGTYLVICGVRGHFLGIDQAGNPLPRMFGFVRVIP
jgi:hypothetical protein